MKYVMFTHEKTGIKVPVVFAEMLTHSSITADPGYVATSAGFYSTKHGVATCHGHSESLNMNPETGDTIVIQLVLAGLESMLIAGQDPDLNLEQLRKVKKS